MINNQPGYPAPFYRTALATPPPTVKQSSSSAGTEKDIASPPSHPSGRPDGDNRSAEQIIKANPSLENFTSTQYPPGFKEKLYRQVGDWTLNNPDPKSRADAAYNAAKVFNYMTSGFDSRTYNSPAGSSITHGEQVGYPPSEGSNAELLGNFLDNGYSVLKDPFLEKLTPRERAINAENREKYIKNKIQQTPTAPAPEQPDKDSGNKGVGTEKNTSYAPASASGRPPGDHRTAEHIIKDNPILNNLPGSIPKEALFKHLGNWTSSNPDPEKRADAAYNAARVFNYIDGTKVAEPTRSDQRQGDGEINGETVSPLPPPFDEVTIEKNSEAERVKEFSEQGYGALGNHGTPLASDNEKIITQKPTSPSGRPIGDTRSAEQILNANPIVARFFELMDNNPHFSKTLEQLKALVGDWTESNKDPESRANAAYNIAKVANYIDAQPNLYRLDDAFSGAGPGDLLGFTSRGANPGTEASILIDFSEHGYAALPG